MPQALNRTAPPQLSLKLAESRHCAATAITKIHSLLCRPPAEDKGAIWRRIDGATRGLWLTFAKLDRHLADRPWEKLNDGDRHRLLFVLSMMTEFFVAAGRARAKVQLGGEPR